ncbi:MAG: UDP-N-acetylmuramoyl-L-alanine--D-glutamate ligase [Candidatus Omnitrophica bacterium]|nr:UDP-N-acetylmuramoyl-L-alanine--D-glutamate ligase [Candidatus Omnitrophota bacterium]
METRAMELKGKRVTVIGLGNSGVNAALLLSRHGAKVFVTDAGSSAELKKTKDLLAAKKINVEIGMHSEAFVKGSDLVVVSPGIEDSSQSIRWALEHKIKIISEMELGYRFCKGRIIAITGTNGKSTVAMLIGEILKASFGDTVVCGNIGNSLCGEVSKIRKDTWVVLEVSSAQLERIEKFKPYIAIILNVTDDHMDRYKNFYEYFNHKLKIFANQDERDLLILNYDAENLRRLKGLTGSSVLFYAKDRLIANGLDIAAYIRDEWICCIYGEGEKEIVHINDITLKGVHNLENVMVSSLVGMIAGVTARSIRDTVRKFTTLEHRFETVAVIDGVEYIDDSKSTTVDSTKRALESCDKPVILIAGGKDKHSDYSVVKNIVEDKVRRVVLIGEASGVIKKALIESSLVDEAVDMDEAVGLAGKYAASGWIVLLSPMCSSFDMYRDYKERGNKFKEAVKRLSRKIKASEGLKK